MTGSDFALLVDFDGRPYSTLALPCDLAGVLDVAASCVCVCLCDRFIDALMFYALSLNAGRLPGSVFFNVFLLSAVELPANLAAAFLLERVGRRPTVGVSTILGGLASFLMIPFMFFPGQSMI